MRVLIVYPEIYVFGGAELVIVRLCNFLTKKGVNNALLTSSIIPEVDKQLNGTKIIVRKNPGINKLYFIWKIVREFMNEYDLINVHNFPTQFSAFLCNKPVVWMCNEPDILLGKQHATSFKEKLLFKLLFLFEKFVINHYIKSIIVSDNYNFERFRNAYKVNPYINYYGIDYDYFADGYSKTIKSELLLRDNYVILHAGMITHYKNQMESLRIINEVKKKIPNVLLVIAGYSIDNYKNECDKYIKENSLDHYVRFTGHLDKIKLREYYHACDVLLHPIRAQGGWLTPFEVLCAKKPIVVSPEMTASNIIMHEAIGVVTDNYIEVIIDIYNNRDKYYKMALHGENWVKNNLSWDKYCEKILEIYNSALRLTD